MSAKERVKTIFAELSAATLSDSGQVVTSPLNGEPMAQLQWDSARSLADTVARAQNIQPAWAAASRHDRAGLLQAFSAAIRQQRGPLAELITLDAGKTPREALSEVDASADILLKTIADASLPPLNGMLRRKERLPVGIVGLITSFNFPLVVAQWSIGPALLAGNAVVWKPSEKTLLPALAAKALFDQVAGEYKEVLQVIAGGRDIGALLVADERVDMVSATGSVAMGEGIKKILDGKRTHAVTPILELGGNNAVIMSARMTAAHLEWSLGSLLHSFLGTTGQRCTNTRRLIVHRAHYARAVERLRQLLEAFIAGDPAHHPDNAYGYGPLIDGDAYRRFEQAKQQTLAEGGEVAFGARLPSAEQAWYVEPALALLPEQTGLMHHETFAPLLFVVPYDGELDAAMALVNAPANAGLVNGIYTLSQREADFFASVNEAGHSVINPAKGTGTPAFGMGFGGNKASGEGEILNSADPLRAFTRTGRFIRVAQNTDVEMED